VFGYLKTILLLKREMVIVITLCGPSQDPLSSSHKSQVPLSVGTETAVRLCYLLAHAESELLTLLLRYFYLFIIYSHSNLMLTEFIRSWFHICYTFFKRITNYGGRYICCFRILLFIFSVRETNSSFYFGIC